MDSADTTRSAPQPSRFLEAEFASTATAPGDTLLVFIPEISLDQPFGDPGGVVWSPMGGQLPQEGDRALVAESSDGSWWVVQWWNAQQSGGSSQADIDALEAADVATDARLDAVEGPEATRFVGDPGQPAFQNGWLHYDNGLAAPTGAQRPAGFYRHLGRVYLTGVIKSGTVGGVPAFTLPTGYRPAVGAGADQIYTVTSNGAFGVIGIISTGDVRCLIGSNVYFTLDGISFRHA